MGREEAIFSGTSNPSAIHSSNSNLSKVGKEKNALQWQLAALESDLKMNRVHCAAELTWFKVLAHLTKGSQLSQWSMGEK